MVKCRSDFHRRGPRRIAEEERRGGPVSQQRDAVSFEITHLSEIHSHTFRENAAFQLPYRHKQGMQPEGRTPKTHLTYS